MQNKPNEISFHTYLKNRQKTSVSKDMEKLKHLYIINGSANSSSHKKTVCRVLKQLKIEYDPQTIKNRIYFRIYTPRNLKQYLK
jgi:hypothetical protein